MPGIRGVVATLLAMSVVGARVPAARLVHRGVEVRAADAPGEPVCYGPSGANHPALAR